MAKKTLRNVKKIRRKTNKAAFTAEGFNSTIEKIWKDVHMEQVKVVEMMANPPFLLEREDNERWGTSPAMFASIQARIDDTIIRALLGVPDEINSRFPEYSDENFEEMGSAPLVKEIMPGMVKLTKEQANQRIKLYLEA